MVQTFSSQSISSQRAPDASLGRVMESIKQRVVRLIEGLVMASGSSSDLSNAMFAFLDFLKAALRLVNGFVVVQH